LAGDATAFKCPSQKKPTKHALNPHRWAVPPCCPIAQALAQFAPKIFIFRVDFRAGEGTPAADELGRCSQNAIFSLGLHTWNEGCTQAKTGTEMF